jgi:hypothetical protein
MDFFTIHMLLLVYVRTLKNVGSFFMLITSFSLEIILVLNL